ncbi:MAG: dockerin type I domain-containing protein, partial [Lacipirellulaceae bacterium]
TASVGGATFRAGLPVTGAQTDWGRDFAAGPIPSAATSVAVEILSAVGTNNHDGYVDLVDFSVRSSLTFPALDLQVNRDTGGITLFNRTGGAVPVSGYSILSAAGSLDPTVWRSIADTADANSGGSIDMTNVWTELTQPGSSGDLSEADLASGVGATLPSGRSIVLDGWVPSNVEDLQFSYVSGGQVKTGFVNYVGNGGVGFALGDFDTDGDIDVADYTVLRSSQLATLGGRNTASYLRGDVNRDGRNNHTDFVLFRSIFDAANGLGSFDAAIASVPEPSSFALLATAAVTSAARRRRPDRSEKTN